MLHLEDKSDSMRNKTVLDSKQVMQNGIVSAVLGRGPHLQSLQEGAQNLCAVNSSMY
jgi:hypothetical protein